jgi:CheY-like chemotaxis protein
MTSDPVILVLEDERAQILTLRSQLAGLGKLVEFTDPEPALEYARHHPCDAAIVDVRMPRSTMDGLAFLRALREFDRDLAIIIRTASESDQIADKAIELRAVKRAVKSKTTLAELRASTLGAIRETRERRETMRNARDTQATNTKLVEALGAYDLRLAAADVHHGLVHSLRDRLTALSALASVLRDDAARSGTRAFADHARRSAELVGGMVDSVNAFLDGPFGEGNGASRAAVNVCLAALRQFFEGAERWAAEGKRLVLRDLMSDTLVEAAPLELVNGLRHLVEFFLLRVPSSAEVTLLATIVHSAAQMDERLEGAAFVLNREALRPERPYVFIRVSGAMPLVSADEVRDAFGFGVQSGRTGNLNVLALVLTAARGAALVGRSAAGQISVDTIVPVAI